MGGARNDVINGRRGGMGDGMLQLIFEGSK